MPTQLRTDHQRLKVARRYAVAVNALLDFFGGQLPDDWETREPPAGPFAAPFRKVRSTVLDYREQAAAQKVTLPTSEACRDLLTLQKQLFHEHKTRREIPADRAPMAETVEYRGFEIRVYEFLDEPTAHKFRPDIFQDDQLVREIHVRSKTPYVSIEHFAKRAIDHFRKYGRWPQKQGVPIKRNEN